MTRTGLLGALVAPFVVAGCGDGVTPSLARFTFDGQAPDSPQVLLLTADFVDDDGDLGEGSLETFINGRQTSAGRLPLLPLFLASDVDPTASDGAFSFVLELSLGSDPPASGTKFDLGARVTDAAGHTSSTKEMTLQIDY